MPDPTDATDLLRTAYLAFNTRNIDAALVTMTPDVAWPRAFLGGFVEGHDAVRAYWTEQWAAIDPSVEPLAFHSDEDGRIRVEVRQIVCELDGTTLSNDIVWHHFTLRDGLIAKMEV